MKRAEYAAQKSFVRPCKTQSYPKKLFTNFTKRNTLSYKVHFFLTTYTTQEVKLNEYIREA